MEPLARICVTAVVMGSGLLSLNQSMGLETYVSQYQGFQKEPRNRARW